MRKLLLILVVLILAAGGAFVVAGFQAPPTVTITKPGDYAGAAVPVELQVASASPADVSIAFEQNAIGAFDDVDQLFGMALSEFRETKTHLQAHLAKSHLPKFLAQIQPMRVMQNPGITG